jgi:hypothetical protein
MLLRLPSALIALASLAVVVTAACSGINPSDDLMSGPKCGSNPTPEEIAESEAITASLVALGECSDPFTAPVNNYTIPVFFNVIYAGSRPDQGNVTDAQIRDQIRVLNQDYKKSGLSFKLESIVRTFNADWFNNVLYGSPKDTAMKNALRRGDATALNVYTVKFALNPGLFGYATFPWDYASFPKKDGVVLNYATLPNGTFDRFNRGATLTHETGHWVGLYHTFQGESCDGPGDYVDDTPAEALPARECEPRDSCPRRPGTDPIHNYMDYTDDFCADNFTPGQLARLRIKLRCHRGIDLAPPRVQECGSEFLLDQTLEGQ